MRVAIAWIILGTLLAFTVLAAVSDQTIRGVAIWMVTGVAVAAGLGAMTMSVESRPPRKSIGLLPAILRAMLSVGAGAVTLLSTMVAGCNDEGGVPSWERCQTWLGNPTVDWPGAPLLALALALGVGYLVWRLLGRLLPNRWE